MDRARVHESVEYDVVHELQNIQFFVVDGLRFRDRYSVVSPDV